MTQLQATTRSEVLISKDWLVKSVAISTAIDLVKSFHYARGGPNTRTYLHGLFLRSEPERCLGVAWWIPPTKPCALATWPANWLGVLCLTRLVIHPSAPKNSASFLLSKSVRFIDPVRWPCLITYADTWQGHTGAIYRACNWSYQGLTNPESVFVKDGVMVARKAGPKTRTIAEMKALGAVSVGRHKKHKFILVRDPLLQASSAQPATEAL